MSKPLHHRPASSRMRPWVAIAILAMTTVFAANGGKRGFKDAVKIGGNTTEVKVPRGTISPGITLPRSAKNTQGLTIFNPVEASRAIPFDISGANRNLLKVPARISPAAPLNACVTYDASNTFYGMVNITPDGLKPIREHEGLNAAWGGTGVGSSYYFNVCAEVIGGTVMDVETYLWETSTWQCIGYEMMPALDVLSYSMTCDPVTEIVYGCFFSVDLQSLEIGTLDPMTMKRISTIGPAEKALYAMGFASDGTLYGIDGNGALYTVSTTDGHYSKVADTGLATDYITGGTVDTFNDVFYYAICPGGPDEDPTADWALYSIDLRNGYNVEKCWELPYEMGGFYVANAPAKDAAPAAPTDTSVDFTDNSLTGTFSFTAPTTTFDGTAATGALAYSILANGKEIAKGTTAYGAKVNAEITVPASGNYTLRAYVANEAGPSPKTANIVKWIGNGRPVAVSGFGAEYEPDNNQVWLYWNPVDKATADAYFDENKVTYSVTRTINGKNPTVIADHTADTDWYDPIPAPGECVPYQYSIVAHFNDQTSDTVTSNFVPVGIIYPRFAPDFLSPLSIGYFVNADNSNHNLEWAHSEYSGAFLLNYNRWPAISADVSLYTAPVHMEAGNEYEVNYSVYADGYSPIGMGLQWGTSMHNLNAMSTLVEPETVSLSNSSWQQPISRTVRVRPDNTGEYYFAIRTLTNNASSCGACLSAFSISQPLSLKGPEAVTDITLKPYYDGAKKLDISFHTPSVTIDGKKLTGLSKIEVRRGDELIKTFRNPTFDTELSFTDQGTKNEDVTYTITPFNMAGEGRSVTVNGHMGVNIPAAPVDCQINEVPGKFGTVRISWTPVAKDIDGNDIDPKLIKYAIFKSDYQTVVKNNITAATASTEFSAIDPDAGQAFVYYLVVPYTEGGANGYAGGFGITPMIPVGTPFAMPYIDSFGGGLHYPMGQEVIKTPGFNDNRGMSVAAGVSSGGLSVGDADGDNGCLAWYTVSGNAIKLSSGNIHIDDADDVAMSYYYTGVPDMAGYQIDAYIIADGIETAVHPTIDTRDCAEKGWNRVQASLTPWRGKDVQFQFFITCESNNFAFGLDRIELRRFPARDLAAGEVGGPYKMTVGKPCSIMAQVLNEGSDDAPEGYTVDLYADGKVVSTLSGPAIKPYSSTLLNFEYTPSGFVDTDTQTFKTIVSWNLDEIAVNNESDELVISLEPSKYPAVTDLDGSLDESLKATLTWTEPDHAPKTYEITETFDDYEPFTVTGFGDWSLYDGDGEDSWALGRKKYPNAEAPMAWMILDKTQIEGLGDYELLPHSGDKVAYASCAGQGDDWMISPELPGIAQTVTFYAATAPYDYGEESLEFYYSTTGTDIDDFIMLGERVDVPEGDWVYDEYYEEDVQVTTWYEYSYNLPEGAKHFAIRYVSDNIWGLYIDDITFTISEETIGLLGYNLFRNGVMLNESPLTGCSFTDDLSSLGEGNYSYALETVYDKGKSGISNIVTVTRPSGIGGVTAQRVNIFSVARNIVIAGAEGDNVSIVGVDGKLLYNAPATGTVSVPVATGTYMVKVGDSVSKIIVK